jgi:hypothetical protein
MGRVDQRVLGGLLAAAAIASAGAVLYFANIWWLSGIVTLSIGAWLAGVLAVLYGDPARRPALVAALAASLLYVTFALGPWFRSQVSPWLLTTRGLAALEHQVFQRPKADVMLTYPMQPNPFVSTGSTFPMGGWPGGGGSPMITSTNISGSVVWALPTANIPAGADLPATTLVQVGHWLCGWIAAGVGAFAVTWARRRASRRSAAATGPEAAVNTTADELSRSTGDDTAPEEQR